MIIWTMQYSRTTAYLKPHLPALKAQPWQYGTVTLQHETLYPPSCHTTNSVLETSEYQEDWDKSTVTVKAPVHQDLCSLESHHSLSAVQGRAVRTINDELWTLSCFADDAVNTEH